MKGIYVSEPSSPGLQTFESDCEIPLTKSSAMSYSTLIKLLALTTAVCLLRISSAFNVPENYRATSVCPSKCRRSRSAANRECAKLSTCAVKRCGKTGKAKKLWKCAKMQPPTQSGLTVSVDSLAGLELVGLYSWAKNQSNLDTSTVFSGENVGFDCHESDPLNYLSFGGNVIRRGGSERVIVRLGAAQAEGDFTDSTEVIFRAGWRGLSRYEDRVDQGPANLRVALRDARTKRQIKGTQMSLVIAPGIPFDCTTIIVAILTIEVRDKVTLRLSDCNLSPSDPRVSLCDPNLYPQS